MIHFSSNCTSIFEKVNIKKNNENKNYNFDIVILQKPEKIILTQKSYLLNFYVEPAVPDLKFLRSKTLLKTSFTQKHQ